MKEALPLELKEVITLLAFPSTLLGILISFHVSGLWSALIALFGFVLLIILHLQIKILRSKDNQYTDIKGSEGQELIASIDAAEKSIVTTAFSADRPSEQYLKTLLRKLEDGVAVTRFMPPKLQRDQEATWLKQFNNMPHYKERVIKGNTLPFDIYIFDDQQTNIYFPISSEHDHFKDGIVFNSKEMANRFRTALDKATNT